MPGKNFKALAVSGLRAFPAAMVLFFLTGCPMQPSIGSPPEYRNFNVWRVDTNGHESVTALKLAEGQRCIVFAAENGQISADTAMGIAAEYDANIYPRIIGVFGDYAAKGFDVDGNGKIILLLVDIRDGYNGTGGYVAGYFDSRHLLINESYSNRADMLFIDINPQVPGGPGFYSNIAHELQHLINYANHNGNPQETWLNEGLSSAAEYIYGGHQRDRVNYFNADPMGTIARGNNFFVWDGYWEKVKGDSLANYATAYLFFQWLRIHAGGGYGIYSAISQSPSRDYRALTQAAKNRIPGITTNATDDEIWDRLLSSWMIANLVKAPAGLYGYKGNITTSVYGFTGAKPWKNNFFPGEGVYSEMQGQSLTNDTAAASGPSIKYAGIDGTQANPAIDKNPPYTGTYLLTYNANPNPFDNDERGYVMNYLSGQPSPGSGAFAGAARSALSSGGLPSSYPIGAHDLRAHGSAPGAGPLPAR